MNIKTRIEALENPPEPENEKTLIEREVKNMTPEQREAKYQELKKKLFEPIGDKIKPELRQKIEALRARIIKAETNQKEYLTHTGTY
jgi:ribosomal protein L29